MMARIRQYLLTLLVALIGAFPLGAQEIPASVEQLLRSHGPTNAGRDFWLSFPSNWDLPGSTAYYIRLYITSDVRTQVKVFTGASVKRVFYTEPGKIQPVDLLPSEAQPVVRADQPPVPPDRLFPRKAIHIEAGAPIVVYGMNRTSFTSDGLLALPTNALGREYIIASYGAVMGGSQELPSQYVIIAPYDSTTVQIYHPHRTPNHAAGETFTITMNKGDVWSAMTVGYNGDMSGAIIKADKPVAVTAGQACTYIPNLLNFCCCDHITEMMLPTESWGKIYHGVSFATRLKGDFYRVFAKEPNTKVYVNGLEYATLSSVGGEEGTGWFEYRSLPFSLVEFIADKPIYVVQYNPSQFYDNVPSDPFFMTLTPYEQYQRSVLFITPQADFPQNFLAVVSDAEGYHHIEISPAGQNKWRVLDPQGALPPKRYPTSVNGKLYVGSAFELDPGAYELRGTSPFAGYIYGFSNYDSYGYPISVRAANRESNDVLAPVILGAQECEGTVDGIVQDMPNTISGRSNLSTIELNPDPAVTENYELALSPYEAGVTRMTSYRLTVIDKSKPAKAVVVATDMAGNIMTDTVTYTPTLVTLLSSGDFGKVRAGDRVSQTLSLQNLLTAPARLEDILLKSGSEGFKVISPNGETVIPPQGTIDVVVEFTADLGGRTSGLVVLEDSLGVRDSCGIRYMATVKGQVVQPIIEVTDHDFGTLPAGVESGIWEMEVRNVSNIEGSTLTVAGISGPRNDLVFRSKGGTATAPFTLEPGQFRTLVLTARPMGESEYRDTIFFESDAMDGDSIGWLRVREAVASVGTPGGIGAMGSLELAPNMTNRDETVLRYHLNTPATLTVTLIDAAGKKARVIGSGSLREAGEHTLRLDLKGLAAGTYAVKVESGGEAEVLRLVIVR